MIHDSGATSHVSNCLESFETYDEVLPGQFIHGLSGKMPIVGKGTVLLQTGLPEGEERYVRLLNVLYVPAAVVHGRCAGCCGRRCRRCGQPSSHALGSEGSQPRR
jgi:hypothetical protein